MKFIFSLSFIFLFSFFRLNAQNIDANLSRYANDFAQEQIYFHYDKSSYAPGETIWFKAYLMKGIFPADESKTIYVDWTDAKGTLLLHSSGPVQDGTSFGQFDIPLNYTGDFIHAKAYTKWMLNFDTSFLYNKDLQILSKSTLNVDKKILPEITFFPEGGDAIVGVINKIAFKANDQFGRPIKIKGIIQNNKGKTIDTIKVIHDGMGYF